MADPTKLVSMRLPTHLVGEVDRRAKVLGINRTEWFENMLEWALVHTHTTEKGIRLAQEKRS